MVESTDTQSPRRVSEVAFNFMRANPGSTAMEIAEYMRSQGVSTSTATSIANSLMSRGFARRDGKKYFVTRDEYPSIEAIRAYQVESMKRAVLARQAQRAAKLAAKAAKAANKRKPRKQAAPVVDAPTVAAAPPVPPVPQAPIHTQSVDQLLATMNVVQAKLVYIKLKEIFG